MAIQKITGDVIATSAVTADSLADTTITAAKLHTTLDLTGKTVTVSTASAGDNDTTVASTAFVATAVANLADSAPSTLDTLNELAAALGDDANFSTTVTNSIATKLPLAGGTLTGRLDISHSNFDMLRLHQTDANGGFIKFTNTDDTDGWFTGIAGTEKYIISRTADNSSPIITIEQNGNVGIGTSSPDNKVNIQESALSGRGASNGNTSLTLEHATDTGIQFFSATQTQLRFGDAASTASGSIIYTHADNILRLSSANAHRFTIGSSEAMRIDSSGKVGIGTDSPVSFGTNNVGLTVNGSAGSHLAWQNNGTNVAFAYNVGNNFLIGSEQAGSATIFTSAGTQRMRIDSSGKVLIGDSASHVDDLLQIETPASGGGHGIQIRRNDSNGDQGIGRIMFGNNNDTDLATISSVTDGQADCARLVFSTQPTSGNSTERMRISSSGVVDITGTIALNGVQSFIPKAWVRFNEDAPTITASGNVSSITETVAGSYIANFTTSLADTDYTTVASMKNAGGSNVLTVGARSFNTSSTGIQISGDGGLDASRTQNEILYSEQFDNAAWTKSSSSITANSQTAPDGTTTADTLTNFATGNNRIYQGITTVAGQRYTTSVHVKKGNNANTSLSALTSAFSSLGGMQYNFDTDTVTGGTLGQNCTRELLSNGWVRLSFSYTATTTSSLVCWVRAGTGNGVANATVHLWGCQHEKGDFVPSTYKQTTSAAVNLDFEDISLVVIN